MNQVRAGVQTSLLPGPHDPADPIVLEIVDMMLFRVFGKTIEMNHSSGI